MLVALFLALDCFLMVWIFRHREKFDTCFLRLCASVRAGKRPSIKEMERDWLQNLLGGLRSGLSLEMCLELNTQDKQLAADVKNRARGILAQSISPNLLDRFLQQAIKEGQSCQAVLQFLKQSIALQIRNERKAKALMAQGNLQAIILSLVPIFLLSGLNLSDSELFGKMWEQSLCLFLWFCAAMLTLSGFFWIKKIQRSVLAPRSQAEHFLEENIPPFLLEIYLSLSAGIDITQATQLAAQRLENKHYREIFADLHSNSKSPELSILQQIRRCLRSAAIHGAPLRDDLLFFLQDIQNIKEARWEEALQTLPLKMLLPLFCCFFSACILICFSIFIPMVQSL